MVLYSVGFGVPLCLSLLMKYMTSGELKFKIIACIYGYSFTSILICVTLCAIPNSMLQLISLLSALVVNVLVLFFNLKKDLNSQAPKAKWLVVGLICAVQIVLILVFKFSFLKVITKED